MGLNETPLGERVSIGFFGCRNSGKSSLVNAVTNQDLSVVSDIKGTTTDAVKKAMELLPLGPVVVIDTPGIDDFGVLGEKRVQSTKKVLRSCDIAVLVTVAGSEFNKSEKELISLFNEKKIPYVVALNKSDLCEKVATKNNYIYTSATQKTGIKELKNAICSCVELGKQKIELLEGLVNKNDFVLLVTPIDSAAPKGRMILPQQQVIRAVLDNNAISVVVKETELEKTLLDLGKKPKLVITDSQVFNYVNKIVPDDIDLTSFSILMARYKGFLRCAVNGARSISNLSDGANILISEGCTHHRQCDDIGTVKLPKWLNEFCGENFNYEWSSGTGFPDDLSKYDLVIHCGGCMLNANEMKFRMNYSTENDVPFTNYGTVIAYINGILDRSIKPLNDNF